ncbi:hypothetical protein FACS189454_01040 [Planctomycetales bacterium]|nr:hypothetical protein FACS189454_01040 [Planctomycetales bacterium]
MRVGNIFFIIFFLSVLTLPVFGADVVQTLLETRFNKDAGGWRAERHCRIELKDASLIVRSNGGKPFITKFVDQIGGEFHLELELRTTSESSADLYWTSHGSPRRDEMNKVSVRLENDGAWHHYDFVFSVADYLTGITFNFSAPDGQWDIRSMKLIRKTPPPFSFGKIEPFQYEPDNAASREMLRFTVRNNFAVPMKYKIAEQPETLTLQNGQTVDLAVPIQTDGDLASVVLTLKPESFPDIVRPVFLYRPTGGTQWIRREIGADKVLEVAPNARLARLLYADQVVAVLAPLIHRDGVIPQFVLANDSSDTVLHFESSDADLRLETGEMLKFTATDKKTNEQTSSEQTDKSSQLSPLEGPVVRLFGTLRSGLLPGVEFLRSGDVSSSPIDIAPPFNDRSVPQKDWITKPIVVMETEKAGIVLRWKDMNLQPTFSCPNRFDQTDDHRFSLIGTKIEAGIEMLMPVDEHSKPATFRVIETEWSDHNKNPINKQNPANANVSASQLALFALNGALQSDAGGQWGYALDATWQRKSYADMLSILFRLNEAENPDTVIPNPKEIISGGADITNDVIFFLTNRVSAWQNERKTALQALVNSQNPDGSFLFRTRFPEVETGVSSFGYTALQALALMEYVRLTGDEKFYQAVKKALNYLRHCSVPGGGFYRDTPFHTPDLQTAATLIWLYVWVYEYEKKDEHLKRAKHFAYSGLPFVYPDYLTVAKFGGTNRAKPFGFGIADTRVGIQYAYALNLLSKYDTDFDWNGLAAGILSRVESLQYTDGDEAGCIPQFYDVQTKKPFGWRVNPCALVALRLAIEGKPEALYLLVDGKDRYTSPYPLRKTSNGVEAFNVPPNRKFQILLNGSRLGNGTGNGIVNID